MGVVLAGCSGTGETVQEALGYEQTGPDAMAVIKRPPLTVPPDYNLRPPRPVDEEQARNQASEAARETLIGPSSSSEQGNDDDVRALLTGTASEERTDDSGTTEDDSEGQALLVSRAERAQASVDDTSDTRDENRVDGAFLRQLLTWTPDDRPATLDEGGETEAGEDKAPGVVQVVSRSQTPIDTPELANPTSAE